MASDRTEVVCTMDPFCGCPGCRDLDQAEIYDDEEPRVTDDQVTISRAEYDQLQADATELARLEEAGVDNWEGY